LEIKQEKTGDLNATLTINVAPEDYREQVTSTLKDLSKRVTIKGFRKGKIPMSVMKKMYGKSVIVEELNKIISAGLENYVKDENLSLVGEPMPVTTDLDLGTDVDKEYVLAYEVGLAPEFTLDYGLVGTAPFYRVSIDDVVLNKEIADMQKRYGPMTNPEESAEGDILFGKIFETDAEGNALEDGMNKMFALNPVRIEDESLKAEMAKPHKAEDIFPITMAQAFPVDGPLQKFWETNVQGEEILQINEKELEEIKAKHFQFEVKKINRTEPMEIGQELFDKAFGEGTITTEEDFRARIVADMEGFFTKESSRYFRSMAIKSLIEGTELPMPEDFLKTFLIRTREQINESNIDDVIEGYLRSLRWRLLVEKMQKADESMTVTEEDLRERAEDRVMKQFGSMVGEDKERLAQFANYFLQEEKMVQEMYEEIMEDRIFAHIAQENPPVEEEITATGFMDMLKAEN
jgi:trigger factor